MRSLVTVFFLFIGVSTFSQSIDPKFTFNVELALPVALGNPPFNDIMQGLVSVSPYAQYTLPFNMHVGAGVKYSYLTINEFAVPSPRYGGMHTGGAYLKLGWDKFHNDRFATDLGMKIGYNQNYFQSWVVKGVNVLNVNVGAMFFEPTLGLILSANEQNSYRWVIGYGLQTFGFNPTHIGLDEDQGYDLEVYNRPTSYLVVGFGYTHYFKSDKD